jgi:dipeptidyl aminopeptidase/acylaminoacyl peptidase
MRTRCSFFLAILLATAIAAPSRADEAATVRRFLEIRSPQSTALLPDGSLLVRDRPDGVYQLHRIVPAGEGDQRSYEPGRATRTKLTNFPDGLHSFSVSPDGKRVIVMHAPGGNEYTALSLLDPSPGGDASRAAAPGMPLTTLLSKPRVQARLNLWLRDGTGFVYSANDDVATDFNLYRWDFAAGRASRVLGEKGAWTAIDVTEDGARLLVANFLSASDVRPHELDLKTGRLRPLTVAGAGATAAARAIGYLPGERAVLIASDHEDGTSRLYVRDLASGKVRKAIPALDRFELDAARIAETRDLVVTVSNENGFGVLRAYRLPGFAPITLPPADHGTVSLASFRGRTLVWTNSNGRKPSIAYATTFDAKGGAPVTRQLTHADDRGIDLSAFALPELVKYRSFDGLEITALLYLPPGHVKGTPIPFLIDYHGGPEGQHRPGFYPQEQYLISRGYGMLMPNVRGSTGFGRAFQMMDDYKKRWDSVKDGVAAAEWLIASGYAEPGRIASTGGSYGGFMSVGCVVEDQEQVERGEKARRAFGACVDLVGVVNLETFLEKTADYRRARREVEYGPLSDREFLAGVSPLQRADKIHVPVFIGHGFNDPRVPVEEAMQLAIALKDRGQNPRVFIAPDEGHGFQKLDNLVYWWERVGAFLDETIGAGAQTARGTAGTP